MEVLQSEKQVRMCWCFFTGDKIISFDFFLSFFVHWVIGMKRKVKNSEYAQKHFFSFINTFQFFKSKTFWLQELRNVERLFWKHFSHQTQERKQCRAKWVNLSLGAPVAEWGETLQTWWNALRHILHYFVLVVNSSVWFCVLCWWMSLTPDLPLCVCSSALCGHRLGPRDEEEILQRERGRGQWEHMCLLLTHRLTVKRCRKD